VNYLIKNGRLVDPINHVDAKRDILIQDGVISRVSEKIEAKALENFSVQEIAADGLVVFPGMIDLHVHLREPGFEYKETIESGARAAAHGGVTTLCAMPNTKPPIDTPERVLDLKKRAQKACVHVLPVGAVTMGQAGETLVDIESMKAAGVVAFSEDGKSVMNAKLFRQALQKMALCKIPMFSHCEEKSLVDGGVINAGKKAKQFGLPGITNAVEDIIAARDIFLAKETGAKLHLCHCSTEATVTMVHMAKTEGIDVSAEVCPHHFTLCEDDILEDHGRYKMNPPLRSQKDRQRLREGLRDGIMDVISTDHAPHGQQEKNQSMLLAPFGIVGLETSFALSYTELVETGDLTLSALIEKMSVNPAKILGLDKGNLAPGKCADLVIADIHTPYDIDASGFASKGKNTPFDGKKVLGMIKMTFVDGNIVYQQEK
jgi:dihydroorotase